MTDQEIVNQLADKPPIVLEIVDAITHPKSIHQRTCDRPLCKQHRVNKGHMHICGRGRGCKGCQVETIDYCPGHANLGPEKPRFQPVTGGRAS